MPPKSTNLNLRLTDEDRTALEEIRARQGPDVSLSDVVRQAIREFIARDQAREGPRATGGA